MSGHTQLPWHVSLPDETLILGPDRQEVATTLQTEEDYQVNCDRRAADAELIVRAVNSHEPLMAALRECVRIGAMLAREDVATARGKNPLPWLERARAAIAAAEPKP